MVEENSPKSNLTGAQKRALRALGHSLHPIVLVGNRGVTDNLVENLQEALLAHELVKVKVHDADEATSVIEELQRRTGADLAGAMGKTALFYRAHPENPKIVLPGAKKKKR